MTFLRQSATTGPAREIARHDKRWIGPFLMALIIAGASSCRAARTPQTDPRYVRELQPLLEQFVQWQEIPGLAIGYSRKYPASGRAADALARAYEMDHKISSAIRMYETAVKLDPTLAHAKERLEHLKR
jgi:hypothetical protein